MPNLPGNLPTFLDDDTSCQPKFGSLAIKIPNITSSWEYYTTVCFLEFPMKCNTTRTILADDAFDALQSSLV